MAHRAHHSLRERQRLARGHEQLLLDQVDPGDRFGNGMLHLDARVEFKEVEREVGRIDEERHARLVSGIAAGRSASSQEIANVIDFLASPGASFVSGQTVTANGGVMFPG
jgi:NAD(P)-dependent dehydrogenase (short-subunit alcohol dehydrogenase family)